MDSSTPEQTAATTVSARDFILCSAWRVRYPPCRCSPKVKRIAEEILALNMLETIDLNKLMQQAMGLTTA